MTTPVRRPEHRRVALALAVAVLLTGCSPTFDWRDVGPQGSGATLLFPCRPDRLERDVPVAGLPLRMQLHSCKAGGFTFSLAVADAADPNRVAPVLAALRTLAIANVEGTAVVLPPATVPGATPNPESRFLRIDGRLPDGRLVVVHACFFVKGLKVYQASVIGQSEAPPREALETFFQAIRVSDPP